MYNPMLDTFITVADYGSFTKAAAQLYISPTAVMKQMNALEQHLQLQLIERTPAGVHLTPAGNVIYREYKIPDGLFQKIHCCRKCRCPYL